MSTMTDILWLFGGLSFGLCVGLLCDYVKCGGWGRKSASSRRAEIARKITENAHKTTSQTRREVRAGNYDQRSTGLNSWEMTD